MFNISMGKAVRLVMGDIHRSLLAVISRGRETCFNAVIMSFC